MRSSAEGPSGIACGPAAAPGSCVAQLSHESTSLDQGAHVRVEQRAKEELELLLLCCAASGPLRERPWDASPAFGPILPISRDATRRRCSPSRSLAWRVRGLKFKGGLSSGIERLLVRVERRFDDLAAGHLRATDDEQGAIQSAQEPLTPVLVKRTMIGTACLQQPSLSLLGDSDGEPELRTTERTLGFPPLSPFGEASFGSRPWSVPE